MWEFGGGAWEAQYKRSKESRSKWIKTVICNIYKVDLSALISTISVRLNIFSKNELVLTFE